MRKISLLAEDFLASKEGLGSLKLLYLYTETRNEPQRHWLLKQRVKINSKVFYRTNYFLTLI